jgi:AraC-like DNA-binding protein
MALFLSECEPSFSDSDIEPRCVWRGSYQRFPALRKVMASGERWGWHRHEYCECLWIERGSVVHRSRLGAHRLAPGDVVFLRPDDAHSGEAPAGGCEFINFVIPLPEARALGSRYGDTWPWSRSGPVLGALSDEERRQATRLAEDRRGLDRSDRDLLLLILLRGTRSESSTGGASRFDLETNASLESAARSGLGPGAAAAKLGISLTHLNRRVRAAAGCTTVQWLGRQRVERAAEFLRSGDRPVLDIALSCHFGGLAHFYRLFRRHYRCSPEAYRREMRAVLPERVREP